MSQHTESSMLTENTDALPTPEPLNRVTVGENGRTNSPSPRKRTGNLKSSPDLRGVASLKSRQSDTGVYDRSGSQASLRTRLRAGTSIGQSTRAFGKSSVKGAKSFRTIAGSVGSLAMPSFRLDWKEEINKAGRKLSITAFVTALLTTLGLNFVFLYFFSFMENFFGVANETFLGLEGFEETGYILLAISGGVIFFLYIFDFFYAEGFVKGLGIFLLICSLLNAIMATLFLTVENVLAPMLVLFFLVPCILLIIKRHIFPTVDVQWYLLAVAIGLLLTSVGSITLFLTWFSFDPEARKFSDEGAKRDYEVAVLCQFDINITLIDDTAIDPIDDVNGTDNLLNSTLVDEDCPQAFLVYVLPLVLGAYSFLFANIVTYTIRINSRQRKGDTEKPIEPVAQIFIIATVLGIVGVWVMASLFASEVAAVSSDVLYLSLIALATIVLIVFSVFGMKGVVDKLSESPLGVKVVQFSESNWVDAFIIFLLMPVVIPYLCISFITQFIRKKTKLGKPMNDGKERPDKNFIFTLESQWLVKRMLAWELGNLLSKVLTLGILWFVFVILIGRVVNVFLSFLSELLAPLSLGITTLIFFGTGLGLFMLPPVPGLPVYLTGGILLSQSAQLNGLSFGQAGGYSILICALIKMCSIVLQQKVLGQMLGRKSVAIRSAVQLNSLELRAMKKIMSVPGLTAPKVAVLVGGPDWPTSVLTGLMGLPLSQMLLGSVPVLITIVPVCFAGALLLEDETSPLAPLSAVLLSVSLVVQLTPFFIAIHYIAKAAIEFADELESEPLDQEVLAYEEKNLRKKEWFVILSKWKNLSMFGKGCHVFFTFLMVVANMSFTFLGDINFRAFDITDTIDEKLDGNLLNLVKTPGYLFLGMFLVSFLYTFVFGKVQNMRVKEKLKKQEFVPEDKRPKFGDLNLMSVRYFSTRKRGLAGSFKRRYDNQDDIQTTDLPLQPISKRQRAKTGFNDIEEVL